MPNSATTDSPTRRWLLLAVTLIALSTILFVTGVAIERGLATPATSTQQGAQSGEATPGDGDADSGHHEASSGNLEQGSASTETVLGLDLENPWVVVAIVLTWLGLAVALLRVGRLAWAVTLGVALLATVLDVAEVRRQVAEARPALGTLAILVALMHLALVMLAGWVLLRTRQEHTLSLK